MNGAGRGTLAVRSSAGLRAGARAAALGQADVVLVLGAPLDFRLGYGRPPTFAEDARVCMVDCDAAELGRNRPLEVGPRRATSVACSSSSPTRCPRRRPRAGARLAAAPRRERERDGREQAARRLRPTPSPDLPLPAGRPRSRRVVTPDTIVVGDGGDVVGCAAKFVPLHRPGQWLDPGTVRLPRRGARVRDRRQAAPSRPARAVDRRRRRVRPERDGDGDRGAVRAALDLRRSATTGAGARSAIPSSRSTARPARSATSLPVSRYDRMVEALGGRGALVTEPRRPRARARARPRVRRGLVPERRARPRRLPPLGGQVSMAI